MIRFAAHPMVLQRLLSPRKTGKVPRLGGVDSPYSQGFVGRWSEIWHQVGSRAFVALWAAYSHGNGGSLY